MNDLTPEAQQMLAALSRTSGWVDYREAVPSARNDSDALMYMNELIRHGYKIERRGYQDEEAFRLTRP